MRKATRNKIFGLLSPLVAVLCLSPAASASSVTNKITAVRVSAGSSPARVSILMQNATSCSVTGWYAFENAADGLGKLWFDALLMALNSGHQVTIVGTGTCDANGVEQISYIDFKPL